MFNHITYLNMRFIIIILFILQLGNCSGSLNTKVALQPLGKFDKSLLDTISDAIEDIYGFHVIILAGKQLPQNAYINIKSARYRADSLLDYLELIKPDTIEHIIGLTESDISTTDRDESGDIKKPVSRYIDWGVFGLGFMPGPSCVISTFRLKHNDRMKFIERLKKVCIHELGHNLGLPHCPVTGCVMGDANETIRTVDKEKLELCNDCKTRIRK